MKSRISVAGDEGEAGAALLSYFYEPNAADLHV